MLRMGRSTGFSPRCCDSRIPFRSGLVGVGIESSGSFRVATRDVRGLPCH
jgi:hypothetical protein